MQEHLQPEFEAQAAADLDAWITARLLGQKQLPSASNSDLLPIDRTALLQDLLSLGDDILPNPDFVVHLEARLRWRSLQGQRLPFTHRSNPNDQQIEDRHKKI